MKSANVDLLSLVKELHQCKALLETFLRCLDRTKLKSLEENFTREISLKKEGQQYASCMADILQLSCNSGS